MAHINSNINTNEEFLRNLSNNAIWHKYSPNNYQIYIKNGVGAFNWTTDANSEQVLDTQILTRSPYILFKPNTEIEAERKTHYNLSIYKTKYTIDNHSRRYVKDTNLQNKNIVFLGCSFTFGTGVSDNESFPFYISKYRPHYNVYNLGIYAAGANDILDDLQNFSRFKDIPKNNGIVIYTAIFDHVERSICNKNCYGKTYRDWVLKKSNYQWDEKNKKLVNLGSFKDSRPIASTFFEIVNKIGLFDSINYLNKLTDAQIELYVLMVAEMKQIAKTKLNADFYFTMYPNYYGEWERIKPYLIKHNINYIDLSDVDLKSSTNNRHAIILDGHPTPLAQYLFASLLHKQLP